VKESFSNMLQNGEHVMPKPEDVLEFWNERAAIHEHDGKYTRDQAEIIVRAQTSPPGS